MVKIVQNLVLCILSLQLAWGLPSDSIFSPHSTQTLRPVSAPQGAQEAGLEEALGGESKPRTKPLQFQAQGVVPLEERVMPATPQAIPPVLDPEPPVLIGEPAAGTTADVQRIVSTAIDAVLGGAPAERFDLTVPLGNYTRVQVNTLDPERIAITYSRTPPAGPRGNFIETHTVKLANERIQVHTGDQEVYGGPVRVTDKVFRSGTRRYDRPLEQAISTMQTAIGAEPDPGRNAQLRAVLDRLVLLRQGVTFIGTPVYGSNPLSAGAPLAVTVTLRNPTEEPVRLNLHLFLGPRFSAGSGHRLPEQKVLLRPGTQNITLEVSSEQLAAAGITPREYDVIVIASNRGGNKEVARISGPVLTVAPQEEPLEVTRVNGLIIESSPDSIHLLDDAQHREILLDSKDPQKRFIGIRDTETNQGNIYRETEQPEDYQDGLIRLRNELWALRNQLRNRDGYEHLAGLVTRLEALIGFDFSDFPYHLKITDRSIVIVVDDPISGTQVDWTTLNTAGNSIKVEHQTLGQPPQVQTLERAADEPGYLTALDQFRVDAGAVFTHGTSAGTRPHLGNPPIRETVLDRLYQAFGEKGIDFTTLAHDIPPAIVAVQTYGTDLIVLERDSIPFAPPHVLGSITGRYTLSSYTVNTRTGRINSMSPQNPNYAASRDAAVAMVVEARDAHPQGSQERIDLQRVIDRLQELPPQPTLGLSPGYLYENYGLGLRGLRAKVEERQAPAAAAVDAALAERSARGAATDLAFDVRPVYTVAGKGKALQADFRIENAGGVAQNAVLLVTVKRAGTSDQPREFYRDAAIGPGGQTVSVRVPAKKFGGPGQYLVNAIAFQKIGGELVRLGEEHGGGFFGDRVTVGIADPQFNAPPEYTAETARDGDVRVTYKLQNKKKNAPVGLTFITVVTPVGGQPGSSVEFYAQGTLRARNGVQAFPVMIDQAALAERGIVPGEYLASFQVTDGYGDFIVDTGTSFGKPLRIGDVELGFTQEPIFVSPAVAGNNLEATYRLENTGDTPGLVNLTTVIDTREYARYGVSVPPGGLTVVQTITPAEAPELSTPGTHQLAFRVFDAFEKEVGFGVFKPLIIEARESLLSFAQAPAYPRTISAAEDLTAVYTIGNSGNVPTDADRTLLLTVITPKAPGDTTASKEFYRPVTVPVGGGVFTQTVSASDLAAQGIGAGEYTITFLVLNSYAQAVGDDFSIRDIHPVPIGHTDFGDWRDTRRQGETYEILVSPSWSGVPLRGYTSYRWESQLGRELVVVDQQDRYLPLGAPGAHRQAIYRPATNPAEYTQALTDMRREAQAAHDVVIAQAYHDTYDPEGIQRDRLQTLIGTLTADINGLSHPRPGFYGNSLTIVESQPTDQAIDAMLAERETGRVEPILAVQQRVAAVLGALAEAAEGNHVVVFDAEALSNRIDLQEFAARVPDGLKERVVLLGDSLPARKAAARNGITRVDELADILVVRPEAETIGFVGSAARYEALKGMLQHNAVAVIPIDPGAGLDKILREMGIPANLLRQVDTDALRRALEQLFSA